MILWAIGFGLSLWGTWLSVKQFSGSRACALTGPAVSVLKPLKGLEPGLEDCLRRFFHLNYPRFELIFCVANSYDESIGLVEKLIAEFPWVDAKIMVGEHSSGINPKVQNLQKAFEAAAYDVLLVSDSNVKIEADYLSKLLPYLDGERVGLVTAVVVSEFGNSWIKDAEAMILGSFYVRGMLMASEFGFPMVMGKSMLFRRSVFERFGGLKTLGHYLAEDYMAGYAIKQLGLKVVISGEPLVQTVAHSSMKDFWNRHLRWGRMRKVTNPLAFIIEPLGNPLTSAAIGASGFYGLGLSGFLSAWVGLSSLYFLEDLAMTWRIHRRLPWNFLFLWLQREVVWPALWVHSLIGSSVNWKGQKLKLQSGGLVTR